MNLGIFSMCLLVELLPKHPEFSRICRIKVFLNFSVFRPSLIVLGITFSFSNIFIVRVTSGLFCWC